MNEIKTVFSFTLKSTLRKKAFRISTVIILAVILILCALPALFSSDADEDTGTETAGYNCYYIDEKGLIPGGAEILASSFPGANIVPGDISDLPDYKNECDSNSSTVVVQITESEGKPFINIYVNIMNTNASSMADILSKYYVSASLAQNGVDEELIALSNSGLGISINPLGSMNLTGYIAGILIVMVIFFAIYYYGYSIASSVASEKSSRVMETLVVSTSPKNILIGKIFGTAVAGMAQMALFVIFAIICGQMLPEDFSIGGMPLSFENFTIASVLCIIILFVVSFFLFAFLYAITGAMVSRTEDLSAAIAPVMIICFVSFYAGYITALVGGGEIKNILSFIPFVSVFSLPFRLLNENISWYIPISAIAASAVALLLVAYAAVKIYSASVLYYGQRLKIRDLFKIKI